MFEVMTGQMLSTGRPVLAVLKAQARGVGYRASDVNPAVPPPLDELWRDVTGRVFSIGDVCWFGSSPKGLEGRLADGSTVLLAGQEIGRDDRAARAGAPRSSSRPS